jgi:hypothetical protein
MSLISWGLRESVQLSAYKTLELIEAGTSFKRLCNHWQFKWNANHTIICHHLMHHLKTCVIYCIASLSPMGTWEVGFCSLEEWLPIIVGNCMLKECLYSVTGGKHTTYSSQCSLKGNWMWNLWQGDMILSLWILTEIYPPRIAATINLKGSRASAFPLTGRHPSSEWWEMFVHVIILGGWQAEFLNPGGSVKDRAALYIVKARLANL